MHFFFIFLFFKRQTVLVIIDFHCTDKKTMGQDIYFYVLLKKFFFIGLE